MNVLNCSIRKSGDGFEGTIEMSGLRRTKLVRASDGGSVYSTRAGVTSAAKKMAERIGFEVSIEDNTTRSSTSKKKTTSNTSASMPQEQETF